MGVEICNIIVPLFSLLNSAEISVLRDVFPSMPLEKLQFALQEYQTVDAAAAFLLKDTGLEEQSDCEGEFDSASFNSTGQSSCLVLFLCPKDKLI